MLIPTKNFDVTASALLFDPEFHLFDLSSDLETTKFLVINEKILEQAPFIDIRFEPLAQASFTLSSEKLFALEKMHNIERPKSVFIFHHAFVCSTLLARCLNQIDAFFSLKEPWILRRLSDIKRAQGQTITESKWNEIVTCYLGLLAKNYHSGKTPVIKVTNVANNLLGDISKYLPTHKLLYLYSDLRSFLISNIKKPLETQQKMPQLASDFIIDGDFSQKYPHLCDINKQSFLQICALIWLLSLYNFKCATRGIQSNTIKTLDMNVLLEDMDQILEKLCVFFGHKPTSTEINSMLHPSITKTNAKQQQTSYGVKEKRLETSMIVDKFGGEIEKVLQWIEPIAQELGLLEFCELNKL